MANLIRHHLTGEHPWTPAELAAEMSRIQPFPVMAWAPLSLLRWYLLQIPADESPAFWAWHNAGLRASFERERAERAAAAELRRLEDEAIAAASTPERRAAIIAGVYADLAAARAARQP